MKNTLALAMLLAGTILSAPTTSRGQDASLDIETSLRLAELLRSARAVVGAHQDVINNADLGDKGLTGEAVLEESMTRYIESVGLAPHDEEDEKRRTLLEGQMGAIRDVMNANQDTINREGVGFKGFVPAVFARLVNESFAETKGDIARVKVTAPPDLVRNRKARPDEWEREIILSRLNQESWPTGEIYHELTEASGRPALRVLVPEYYSEACLACHGGPAGETDITGYPKEGGELGDLGGVISITIFQ